MWKGDAPSSRDGSGFAEFPGARLFYFLIGMACLAVHAFLWRAVAKGDEELKGHGGAPWVLLAFTAVFAGVFLLGAFRRRRAGVDEGPSVPLAPGGVETPAGVPTEPLKPYITGDAANRVRRPREGVLVVAPTVAMEVFLIGVGVFWTGVMYAIRHDMTDSGWVGFLACPVFIGTGCLLLLGRMRNVFNLEAGFFRRTNVLGLGRKVPLSKVRAVQILTDIPRETKVDSTKTEQYEAFQLNLVLHDPDRPRRFLLEDRDRASTERIGREVADFLGVPLYRTSLAKTKSIEL